MTPAPKPEKKVKKPIKSIRKPSKAISGSTNPIKRVQPAKKKKKASQRAKEDCFELIQKIAVLQDPKCIVCQSPSICGHHVFGRGLAAAFNPEVVRGVCLNHHQYAHILPDSFRVFMEGFWGKDRYEELERQANTVIPYIDFEAKLFELKGILTDLQRRKNERDI